LKKQEEKHFGKAYQTLTALFYAALLHADGKMDGSKD
jgi:hypothetical protein